MLKLTRLDRREKKMVQITLKSVAAIRELLSITKEDITLTISEEVASKFFEVAMKKRLLQEVEFENKEEQVQVSREKKQSTSKSCKGLTGEIKKIFEENSGKELTRKDLNRNLPSELGKTGMSSILRYLVQSGYLQENSVDGVKKYKKAEWDLSQF